MEESLRQTIRKYYLEDSVALKAYINQRQIPKVLLGYDVFIRLPSQEGFGISFIEAMAAGVIAIGSSVGGITDIISHQETGYLINLNHSSASQLINIIRDQKNWPRVRNSARKKVISQFSWEKVYRQIMSLYPKNTHVSS